MNKNLQFIGQIFPADLADYHARGIDLLALENKAFLLRAMIPADKALRPHEIDVLRAYRCLYGDKGLSPTLQEVSNECGRHRERVRQICRKLQRKGWMKNHGGVRGWRLTEAGRQLRV